MSNTLEKNATGYGYKYTDLAQINKFIESIGETYYQYIDTDENGNDYIVTVREKNGNEIRKIRGCRIISAALSGKNNPVQEYGAGITYIRRYSLLMAYGLATEDTDAAEFNPKKKEAQTVQLLSPKEQDIINILLEENNLTAEEVFGIPTEKLKARDFKRAQNKIQEMSKAEA